MVNQVLAVNSESNSNGASLAEEHVEKETVFRWMKELCSIETRENALIELSRRRDSFPDLAPLLWHSFGCVSALLQEVLIVYQFINPPTLTGPQSARACNSLALLQCIANHPETRPLFLNAQLPLYLYPFLHANNKSRPFEYLRLTALGVIGALVKNDEKPVIVFLIQTEIIPLCLRIMELGTELSKTVATFILQKILCDDGGLAHVCATYERFGHLCRVLAIVVAQLVQEPSARLLRHIVRVYLRLSENVRAREPLNACLPMEMRNNTFAGYFKDDQTKKWMAQLHKNLES